MNTQRGFCSKCGRLSKARPIGKADCRVPTACRKRRTTLAAFVNFLTVSRTGLRLAR